MDLLTSKTSYGDTSRMKLRKDKKKSADNLPHCDLPRDDIPVEYELQQQAEEKGEMKKLKKKKHKNKDSCKEADVTEFSDVQSDKKKRKLNKDVCTSGEMGRIGLNVDESSPPRKIKKSVGGTESFVKIGEESKVNVYRDGKQKLLNINVDSANDSILSLCTKKITEVSENFQVVEENVDSCRQNPVENQTLREVCEAAEGKKRKKKKKAPNLSTQEGGFSGEQSGKDDLTDLLKNYHCEVGEENFDTPRQNQVENLPMGELCESARRKNKRKKKKESDLSAQKEDYSGVLCVKDTLADASASLLKIDETKAVIDPLPTIDFYDYLKTKSSTFYDFVKAEIKSDNEPSSFKKKRKVGDESSSMETGCNSRKVKEEQGASHNNNSLYQEHIVENLWNEIKLKIEREIQDGKKNQKKETASQQLEEVLTKNNSNEDKGVSYSMVFKFDNNPYVRHYVPRKVMALNGLKPQLGEMTEIDLKIPRTCFKGSSLDSIPGYGYNT